MSYTQRLGVLTLFIFTATNIAVAREWRDNSGQFSKEAQFVALRGDRVWLKDNDGRNVSIVLNNLSPSDRQYIAQADRRGDPFEMEPGRNELPPPPKSTATPGPSLETPTTAQPPQKTEPRANYQQPQQVQDQSPFGQPYHTAETTQTPEVIGPPMHPPEQLMIDQHDAKGPKGVYCAYRGTFSVVGGNGTARYSLMECDGCYKKRVCYLSLLVFAGEDPTFHYYWPLYGDADTSLWSITKDRWSCLYRIWRYSKACSAWVPYDGATRDCPH